MKKQFITEAARMQKLAGIINESEKLEKTKYSWQDNVFPRWNEKPKNSEEILVNDEEDEITKGDFWKTDILSSIKSLDDLDDYRQVVYPSYGTKLSNGKWSFTWDSGDTFDGFVEGDDFEFKPI